MTHCFIDSMNKWIIETIAMKFTRYSKFNGLDVYGINLGDLMESLSDSLLSSGYDDDYYWTREQMPSGHITRCFAARFA